MRKFIFLAIFLAMLYGASAATISGTVYNMNLDKVEDAIVAINTEPRQTYVAKNGTYNFNLNPGQYTIIAFKTNGENLELTQKIVIKEEGDYLLDLILFPTIREEEELLNVTQYELGDSYFDKTDYLVLILIPLIVIASFALVFFFILRKKKEETEKETKTEEIKKAETQELKDDAEKILEFVRKEGGRTTQKDIRKEFPSSEAKISLIITELEHKGKVERIKKGRGNIVKIK